MITTPAGMLCYGGGLHPTPQSMRASDDKFRVSCPTWAVGSHNANHQAVNGQVEAVMFSRSDPHLQASPVVGIVGVEVGLHKGLSPPAGDASLQELSQPIMQRCGVRGARGGGGKLR